MRIVGTIIASTKIKMIMLDTILFVLEFLNMSFTSLERILYMIFPIFTIFAAVFGIMCIYMKNTTKNISIADEEYWERERKANSTRKQPLTDLTYVKIPLETFPIGLVTGNERIDDCERKLQALSELPIVNLSEFSNTDLKLKYGVANITILSEYDQNFLQLVRVLHEYGKELMELGYEAEAETVLQFAILSGSDIKGSYLLLTDYYEKQGAYDKIELLMEQAEGLTSLMKKPIINALREHSILS